ncbi:MAG: chromosome segregation protein SMC [Bacteroidota bacterium]
MESNQSKQSPILIGLVAFLAVVVLILGYYVYNLSNEKDDALVDLAEKQEELQDIGNQLDSLSAALQEVLAEKERLGIQDDSLRQVIAQLETEKRQIRSGVSLTNRRYQEIKAKLSEYETLLEEKDKEIARLREENEGLKNDVENLSSTVDNLSGQLTESEETKQRLSSKLTEASALKAYNIKTIAINKRGKERDDSEYKNRHIEKLKFTFQVGENKAADPGNRKILVRIVEPGSKAISDLATGSGSFDYNGSEIFYTTAKEILYDNSSQDVTVLYNRGKDYKEGKHIVELYAEGNLIGKSSFLVK